MAKDTLTLSERECLTELLKLTTESQALDMLALERGEHLDLWIDGKPEPWPAKPEPPPRPPAPQPEH